MTNKKDNSTIHRVYKDLCARASNIPNFQIGQKQDVKYDITELANNCVKYLDLQDDFWSDVYYSALMVRYWHMIAKIYDKVKPYKVSVEEVVTILYESLNKAMKYRSWLDDSKYVSKEAKGAEKVINQCITSTVSNYIKAMNINAVKMIVDNDDEDFESSVTYNDSYDSYFGCSELVQRLINKGNYITAMVVDLISYKDLTSKKAVCSKMNHLDAKYLLSFMNRYRINDENIFVQQLRAFDNLTERDKNREITESFKYLKSNERLVRSFVC